MDEKGIQDNNMIKRKRPDARAFREGYMAQVKKHKSAVIGETALERSDKVLYDSNDNPQDSSLILRESKSEAHSLHSKQLRTDSEVKLHPGKGDPLLEQEWEQASSSTDVNLNAITPGKMMAGENLRAEGSGMHSEASDRKPRLGESSSPVSALRTSMAAAETQHVKGTENGMTDASSQNGDSGLPPDHLLTKTEILSVESDSEDDAASMPRVVVLNIVECNNPILVPENGASCSAAFRCKKQSQDLPHASNREIEGAGSTNMDSFVEASREVIGDHSSGCLESDGENDVKVTACGEHGTRTEPFNDVSDLGTSKENQLLYGQKENPSGWLSLSLATSGCALEKTRPMLSTNPACNEIAQTTASLAVPNSQSPGMSWFCLPNQSPDHLVNLGSCDLPMVQTAATMSLPLQSHVFSGTTILRPANNYFQDNSSLMPNNPDPLLNELVKSHATKMKKYESDCQKELKEVRKKYNLLLQETENEFLMKNPEIESHIRQVYATKPLADNFRHHLQMQAPSQEALWSEVHLMSIPQHHTSQYTVTPVHLIPHLSDLNAADQAQRQNSSVSNGTENPLVGYRTRALGPHIGSSRPASSLPETRALASDISSSRPTSSLLDHASQYRVYFDGTQDNPIILF